MRYKVTVVGGAGNVGATAGQLIAQADVADVVLMDVAGELATGKALDMMESAPVLGFNARITGGSDYALSAGSDICVITAGLACLQKCADPAVQEHCGRLASPLRSGFNVVLDKRGLPRPTVNWAAIKEIQRRAKG